jgi:Rieske Fe-S protein
MSDCKNCDNCDCGNDAPDSPERRKLLGISVGIINGVIATAIIGPVVGFVGAPLLQKRKGIWVKVLSESDLPPGETKDVKFTMHIKDGFMEVDREYALFMRRSGDKVLAFDPACPHLGCRVDYQSDKGRFFCPCHGAVFDDAGAVVAGPPARGLFEHKTKIEDDHIWVYREV